MKQSNLLYNPKEFTYCETILQEMYRDTLSDDQRLSISKFRELNIAPVITKESLSMFLTLDTEFIESLQKDSQTHYRIFSIPKKKSDEKRKIYTPKLELKVVQWWILDNILNRVALHPNVFGFVRGKSIKDNAEFHQGAKHVLTVDIKNFFPSIRIGQVVKIFESLCYEKKVAQMLANLCCIKDPSTSRFFLLPQGAPTSPAISNLVSREMDAELANFAKSISCKYSRYADDMTFSSQHKIGRNYISEISQIVKNHGFNLNSSKTRFLGLGEQMKITGLVINQKVQPSRFWRRKIRSLIHNIGKKEKISQEDYYKLTGIKGNSKPFTNCPQMSKIVSSINHILTKHQIDSQNSNEKPNLPSKLTVNEALTLIAMSRFGTSKETASTLLISESTVRSRLRSAYKKIGVHNSTDAQDWLHDKIGTIIHQIKYKKNDGK